MQSSLCALMAYISSAFPSSTFQHIWNRGAFDLNLLSLDKLSQREMWQFMQRHKQTQKSHFLSSCMNINGQTSFCSPHGKWDRKTYTSHIALLNFESTWRCDLINYFGYMRVARICNAYKKCHQFPSTFLCVFPYHNPQMSQLTHLLVKSEKYLKHS